MTVDFSDKNAEPVEITMLGGFSLRIGERILRQKSGRAKKLWILLEYLIANRRQDLSQEKLIETLWGEDDDSGNPANALKNLVYRARRMLDAMCGDGQCHDFILFRRNIYSWNNDIPCVIDVEEMEKAFRSAKKEGLPDDEALRCYLRVDDLYKGDFLPESASFDWVVTLSAFYRNMFIESVWNASRLLLAGNRFEDARVLCERAVTIDPYDEAIHESIIRAHLLAGNRRAALAHYERISEMFYRDLGVKLSDRLRGMMKDVMKSINGVERDLDAISADLREMGRVSAAYLCDYEVFRHIYRLEARMAERFGQSVFVALLTLEPVRQLSSRETERSMETLRDVILHNLRKNDVVARYSQTQYVLMLPSLTYENGERVLARIDARFRSSGLGRMSRLTTRLNPLVLPE